jgi:hypothetical protein
MTSFLYDAGLPFLHCPLRHSTISFSTVCHVAREATKQSRSSAIGVKSVLSKSIAPLLRCSSHAISFTHLKWADQEFSAFSDITYHHHSLAGHFRHKPILWVVFWLSGCFLSKHILIWQSPIYWLLLLILLDVVSENTLMNPILYRITLLLSFNHFIYFLNFTFRSTFHFWIIFVCGMTVYVCNYLVDPILFLKMIFSIECCWHSCLKLHDYGHSFWRYWAMNLLNRYSTTWALYPGFFFFWL